MNIIQNSLFKNDKSEFLDISQNLELNSLTGYFFCKAVTYLTFDNMEHLKALFSNVFELEELKKLGQLFLSVLKETDEKSFNALIDARDGKFDFGKVMTSFFEFLKDDEDDYKSVVEYICQEKLEQTYKNENPLEKYISTEYMQNFFNCFGFSETEAKIFTANVYAENLKWIILSDQEKNHIILSEITGCTQDEVTDFYKNINKFTELGLYDKDNRVFPFVHKFFIDYLRVHKIKAVEETLYNDFYELDAIDEANKENRELFEALLEKCRNNTCGCFISVENDSVLRTRNYISNICRKNGFNVYEITRKSSDSQPLKFVMEMLFYAAQLSHKNGVLLVPEKLAEDFIQIKNGPGDSSGGSASLPVALDDSFALDIFDSKSPFDEQAENEARNSKAGFNIFKLIDLIQIPVIFMHGSEEIEEKISIEDAPEDTAAVTDDDDIYEIEKHFAMYWNLKNPKESKYEALLSEYLKKSDIPDDIIKVTVSECKRIKLEPERWDQLAAYVYSLKDLSKENLLTAINTNFCEPVLNKDIRVHTHYSLEALNTSSNISELIESIKNAEKWQQEQYDADSGLRILLYGPSGTGKTAFVEHIAMELKRPFKYIRASDVLFSHVGETERAIQRIFSQAEKDNEVLLIDEADSLFQKRENSRYAWEISQINELLIQMERFPGILFCCTNFAKSMDSATNRRFHKQIEFKPLKKEGIRLLCEKYFSKYEISESDLEKLYKLKDICPGDFGNCFSQLKFVNPQKVDKDFVINLLSDVVKAKNKDNGNVIGFI